MATAVRSQLDVQDAMHAPKSAETTVYRVGDPVPTPGTYWVSHQKHRPVHAAKVRFTAFPPCAQCGNKVRFITAVPEKRLVAEWLRRDPDFKEALKTVRRRRK